ncbi:hypothetical protein HY745_03335 [Candidatus Desantisbacteria bacterium]|nr:hypothetical protein [Candidatus Desantisbacteria bacterium]
MKLIKKIIIYSLFLLIIIIITVFADKSDDRMGIYFEPSGNFIFSNASGALLNKGNLKFHVTHKELTNVDIMVNIETTGKNWKFNKINLKPKDGSKFYSEPFLIEWDGLDKDNNPVVSGQYVIKIIVLDEQDNVLEDSTGSFFVDNSPPEIRKIEVKHGENSELRIEAQIFDDSKMDKVIFKNTTGEELTFQSNTALEGEYFLTLNSGKLLNKLPFHGTILAKDKTSNVSTAKIAISVNPDIIVKSDNNIMYFNAGILAHNLKIQGNYSIGTLKVTINENYENTYNLEGTNWIKKIEIRNTFNDKILVPILNEAGEWEANVGDFLTQGENQLQYNIIDYFGGITQKTCPITIVYDRELPVIIKAYQWAKSQIMLEMSEKVMIVPNTTLFEVELTKSAGMKNTYNASGRLINNDMNIEVQPEQEFLNAAEKGDKVIVKLTKISDIAGNMPDKVESMEFIYEK